MPRSPERARSAACPLLILARDPAELTRPGPSNTAGTQRIAPQSWRKSKRTVESESLRPERAKSAEALDGEDLGLVGERVQGVVRESAASDSPITRIDASPENQIAPRCSSRQDPAGLGDTSPRGWAVMNGFKPTTTAERHDDMPAIDWPAISQLAPDVKSGCDQSQTAPCRDNHESEEAVELAEERQSGADPGEAGAQESRPDRSFRTRSAARPTEKEPGPASMNASHGTSDIARCACRR